MTGIKNKSAVEKRKLTIMNKRIKKEESKKLYHAKMEHKYILNAGATYATEKNVVVNKKFLPTAIKEIHRNRNKEKRERKALGDMFKETFFDGSDLTYKDKDGITHIKYNEIKRKVHEVLDKEFNNIPTNLQLLTFVTIKYTVGDVNKEDEVKTDDELLQENKIAIRYFNSDIGTMHSRNIIDEYTILCCKQFEKEMENIKGPSNLTLHSIMKLSIKTSRQKQVFGKSYIELPDHIKNKKACVNIKNTDDKCFLWSLLAYKHYDEIKNKDKNKTYNYEQFVDEIIEPDNFTYPVHIQHISEFERLNNLKINVFVLDDENTVKLEYNNFQRNKDNTVNLLLIYDGDKSHYVWIKDLSRLASSKTCHTKKYICNTCFLCFNSDKNLFNHLKYCGLEKCNVELPKEGSTTKFKNFGKEFMHPFHVVADFESTLEKVDQNNEFGKYQKHVQNSYGLKYNCIHNEFSEDVKIFNSANPEEVNISFIEELERLAKNSYELLQQNKTNIIMTNEDKMNHSKCNCCNNCKKEVNQETKVKHHDHITGQFISTLCNDCNLLFTYETFLPVYIHNLKGYDSHLFVTSLFTYGYQAEKSDNISCIPNNEERYISFSKHIEVGQRKVKNKETKKWELKPIMFEIRFLDTFAFMSTSIESLANNLKANCKTTEELRLVFKNTSEEFTNDEQFLLMTEKGVYPYDYISTYDKLNETKLPPQNAFYSQLYKKKCSNEDYQQAKKVWSTFQCESILDYHNIYLKSDVLLLADIWENFRAVCYKNYGLDCEYYYTSPSLSWDAMLKITNIELELITDLDQYLFIERGIRGGISQISHRHATANNKYMSTYDETKTESSIVYLDANNLYGHAMCQYLPYKDFEWSEEVFNVEDIMNLDDEGEKGYLFSVDLHIPEHLHDHFNNYPPCAENISIKKDDLSKWQQQDYKESKIEKLCITLKDKIDYVVNYRYLKLVLSLGVELVKVNKVLKYSQKDFMKQYIMLNTNLRTISKNDFEKDFYKLMNNSVYGKTMENVRNRINFRLISTEDESLRVKNMKRFTIFNENLVGVHIQKTLVKLTKPIYLGMNILDDSKHLMYNFHYNFMLKKIKRENIDLLFTDTDSLCYTIRNQDIFQIMKENKELFDLSNYPKDHELYDATNAKVIGKFKNESVKQITEFIGLRSKLYSYVVDKDSHSHNRCKGVKRNVVENELTIKDYKHTLETRESKKVTQNNIRSYGHQLFTEIQEKIALSAKDDKVYICDDNIRTYSFGHYKISK